MKVFGRQDTQISCLVPKDESVAYLFPGQGSQTVGMGQDLYNKSPAARSVFENVDRALGRPLSELLFAGPADQLQETVNAQPAIMAVSLACVAAMRECLPDDSAMLHPAWLAGHSLGEYTALAVAGVLGIDDTAQLVQERGRLMQKACEQNPGSMAAILHLDLPNTEAIARETGTFISNVNTEEQIVISGEQAAVSKALNLALTRGAKRAIQLNVSGAFHSALMEPAKAGLAETVKHLDFKDPDIPIVANCTGQPLTTGLEAKQELLSQICNCVQWKQSVDFMTGAGVSSFVEVGPGKSLAGMVKRIDPSATAVSVGDIDSINRLSRN